MANHCQKHSPPLRSIIRALLCPRMQLDCPDAKCVLSKVVVINVIVVILQLLVQLLRA